MPFRWWACLKYKMEAFPRVSDISSSCEAPLSESDSLFSFARFFAQNRKFIIENDMVKSVTTYRNEHRSGWSTSQFGPSTRMFACISIAFTNTCYCIVIVRMSAKQTSLRRTGAGRSCLSKCSNFFVCYILEPLYMLTIKSVVFFHWWWESYKSLIYHEMHLFSITASFNMFGQKTVHVLELFLFPYECLAVKP